jgi:LemA protein
LARQAYNDSVMRFNGYRRSFPPVVVAPMFGYSSDAATLELGERAVLDAAPAVKF